MARKSKLGDCRICGMYRELSFEHVPPKSAFNNQNVAGKYILELINKNIDSYFDGKGHISQRGSGAHTLCKKCNNNTDKWYGESFANFAHQSLDILNYAKDHPSLHYTFHIHPLRVIKQIITMFFSVNNHQFRRSHPDLVKFVLDKHECHLRSEIQILVYLTLGPHSRFVGGTSMGTLGSVNPDEINRDMLDDMLNGYQNNYPKSLYLSEIAFPPLGYALSFGLEPLDNELTDISFFAKHGYDEKIPISLRFPVSPVYTYYPTDYRTKEQVQRDFEENTRIEKEIQERKQAEKNQ